MDISEKNAVEGFLAKRRQFANFYVNVEFSEKKRSLRILEQNAYANLYVNTVS